MHSVGSWPISQFVWLQLVGVPAAGKCAIRVLQGSARVVGALSDSGRGLEKQALLRLKLSACNWGPTHLALQDIAEFRGGVASTVVHVHVHVAWSGCFCFCLLPLVQLC